MDGNWSDTCSPSESSDAIVVQNYNIISNDYNIIIIA